MNPEFQATQLMEIFALSSLDARYVPDCVRSPGGQIVSPLDLRILAPVEGTSMARQPNSFRVG
jgi:hypothetical protein